MGLTQPEITRYKQVSQSVKDARDGIIGVSLVAKHKSRYLYRAKLPDILGGRQKSFYNPFEACCWYNITVTKKLKDDAVLCDPLAIARQFRDLI